MDDRKNDGSDLMYSCPGTSKTQFEMVGNG